MVELNGASSISGGSGSDLPAVTTDDNGKVLGVVEGAWSKYDLTNKFDELTRDIGKIEIDINSLSSQISAVGISVNSLSSQVGINTGDISDLNTAVGGLDTRINTLENRPYVEVTADGIKTLGQLLNDLYALAPSIGNEAFLKAITDRTKYYHLDMYFASLYRFINHYISGVGMTVESFNLGSSSAVRTVTLTASDDSIVYDDTGAQTVITSGYKYRLYY